MLFSVTDHFMRTAHRASFYLASGPEAGPLIIFVHGWPELSHSWRHQLRCFASLGFVHTVAPAVDIDAPVPPRRNGVSQEGERLKRDRKQP
jgi:pimeloyl-ACP methyl ester carboxylesterase